MDHERHRICLIVQPACKLFQSEEGLHYLNAICLKKKSISF